VGADLTLRPTDAPLLPRKQPSITTVNYYTPVVALTAAVCAAADTQHDGVSGEKTHDSHIKPEASFGGGWVK